MGGEDRISLDDITDKLTQLYSEIDSLRQERDNLHETVRSMRRTIVRMSYGLPKDADT